jgi:hypothetical protein
MICPILGHGSPRLDSGDNLDDFINKGTETKQEIFCSYWNIAQKVEVSVDHDRRPPVMDSD